MVDDILDEYYEELPLDCSDVPPLPESARVDPVLGTDAGTWVNAYIDYARNISPMTPDLLHESAALFLAATAIARRLVLKMPFGDVYPNLFILWIAVTTFFRKSTALLLARDIAYKIFPFLLAAQDTTPEALLSDLAGKEPAFFAQLTETEQKEWQQERNFAGQRGLFSDEMSGLLAASGKDYNQGLTESLIRLYDCDPNFKRSTRGQGRITVKNSCLSILGASTPAAMAPHISAGRLWEMGFWSRFAILTPEIDRPSWKEAKEIERPASLIDNLQHLFTRLPAAEFPESPQPLSVSLGTGVFQTWNRYNRVLSYDLLTPDLDNRLYGTYGRLPTQVLKIATILAALDWTTGNTPCIELPQLARAISIAESWRTSAHRAIVNATNSTFERESQRLIRIISQHEPYGVTMRDICRAMRDKKPSEIELILTDMVKAGEIYEVESRPGSKGGRPTSRYRITRE
jgi:hypothetical protein